MTAPTNRVDLGQPGANMFGVVPCPKCHNEYRVLEEAEQGDGPKREVIVCDDCKFVERVAP